MDKAGKGDRVKPGHLHILQHALGLDQYGRGNAYRNHFVTGPGSTDWDHCLALEGEGLMMRADKSRLLPDSDQCFTVTVRGRAAVLEYSPEPPEISRAKKRYREWLHADCGMRFGEWLKWKAKKESSDNRPTTNR